MIFMNSPLKYKVLSYSINAATPMYGNAPEASIKPYSEISKGDTSNSYIISLYNHAGTHIDASKHFVDNGRSISDYSLDELIFKNPILVDCPKDNATLITPEDMQNVSHLLQNSDCLLFHTGFGQLRAEKKYRTHNPGIAPETILWIRKEYPGIRCMGIDSISISSFQHRKEGREAHKAAFIEQEELGKPLLLIEDMKLDILLNERLEIIIVLPWQIDGLDSVPCNIIATIKENY